MRSSDWSSDVCSSDLELQCENGYAPGALYENRLPRKCGTVRHDRPPRRNTGASERRGLGVAIAARSARKPFRRRDDEFPGATIKAVAGCRAPGVGCHTALSPALLDADYATAAHNQTGTPHPPPP